MVRMSYLSIRRDKNTPFARWGISGQANARHWSGWKGKGGTWMGQERKGRDNQKWQGNASLGRNVKGMPTRCRPGNASMVWGAWACKEMQGKGGLAEENK